MDNKEGERPRRQRKRAKKPTRIVKQTWLVKKPEVSAGTKPKPQRKVVLQGDPAHEIECTEMGRENIEHVQQNTSMPCQTKDGISIQDNICCNPVNEDGNDKGKAAVETRDDGRRGQQEDPGPSCPLISNSL